MKEAPDNKKAALLFELIQHAVQGQQNNRELAEGSEEAKQCAADVDELFKDRVLAVRALRALFPEGIPTDKKFFERLDNLHMKWGWGELSNRLTGLFLSEAIKEMSAEAGETLLSQLPLLGNPGFFEALGSLQVFVEETELRAEFGAQWFPALVCRIGNDLASGEFWKALETYCERHPENALAIIRCLSKPEDDSQVSVAACILGVIRTINMAMAPMAEFNRLAELLADAQDARSRSVFHRSWVGTAWRGKISRSEMAAVIGKMSKGTTDEQQEAFWIVTRFLLSSRLSADCFNLGFEWLQSNVSRAVTPTAKHNVVDFAAVIAEKGRWEVGNLILGVQPIPVENEGTWRRVEFFLVRRLETDLNAFCEFGLKLAAKNAHGWLVVMRKPKCFDWLLSQMKRKHVGEFVGRLALSVDGASRQLGLFFFDELELTSLPPQLLDQVGEQRLRVTFLELQRVLFDGKAIGRYLALLTPYAQRAGDTFQQEFYAELVLQAKNYGGACREEFKQRANEFPMLKKALDEADCYFDALRRVRQSGIAQMQVPGYRQATRLLGRRSSEEIRRGTESNSIIGLFKHVHLLYGKQWSSFLGGKLGESSGLHQISTTIEIPRLEVIDPEGMVLRRLQVSAEIATISKNTKDVEVVE